MKNYRLGIDIGSTTVKLAVVEPESGKCEYSVYRRHNAKQAETVLSLLTEFREYRNCDREKDGNPLFRVAVCGSGGKPIAEAMGLPFVQEVVANAAAVGSLYPAARTAIELGGQDAKVIFFRRDENTGKLLAEDMRMNGCCAGGTGAFIDEIAALLQVKTEDFDSLAAAGTIVYDISGRCGVFAKTDIQPLLIQGAKREDIALSAFHAIAKQTIGGLSQGLELKAPIVFEGGPLTFNPTLVRVFAERLQLDNNGIIRPEHPETMVAYGTAIAVDQIFPAKSEADLMGMDDCLKKLEDYIGHPVQTAGSVKPYFRNQEEKEAFLRRHRRELQENAPIILSDAQPYDSSETGHRSPKGSKTTYRTLPVYIGIDSGSTTSKFVVIDERERVIDRFYQNNRGLPLDVLKVGLLALYEKYERQGIRLLVRGLGTTGYGEEMTAEAFGADYHTVETVAHANGVLKYVPDASFVLDIGGQDMKAIWINNGIITNIMLNEACSSGCGSFLENFASTLQIPVEKIAEHAFHSETPAKLGSRCTVFMNSTIINEQRNGKHPDDIMAGLCRSIIENVFTKVVRISNTDSLGDRIVVQGGTFRNFAVLRALEEYLGKEVTLAPYPGEMGALGVALLVKRQKEERPEARSRFIGFGQLRDFTYSTEGGVACEGCSNHCKRTIVAFSTGKTWITGNKCERGGSDEERKNPVRPGTDIFALRRQLLTKKYEVAPVCESRKEIIGIPLVLEFWDSLPFWTTFFTCLGYTYVLSKGSSRKKYEQGLQFVTSDTICYPAKLVHGHIRSLAEEGATRIFFPYVMHMPPEGTDKLSPYVCSVLQGYPMVVKNSQNPADRYGVLYDTPIFHWFSEKNRRDQIIEYAVSSLHVTKEQAKSAFLQGERALLTFRETLQNSADRIIAETKAAGGYAVVLAGRPYHTDSFVSHDISRMFTSKGISVLTVDSLKEIRSEQLGNTRVEITNNFHTRMLAGALTTAKNPVLEYVQIVSFGCGHDAVLSDEIVRIMNEVGEKPPLILKVDESEASGSLRIRVQSFLESIRIRRGLPGTFPEIGGDEKKENADCVIRELETAFPAKFYPKDRKKRLLIIPNISEEVAILLNGIIEKEGFVCKTIPIGGVEQIHIGKKYSHNDICFPAQMVIGELIDELQKGKHNQDEVAVGMVKFQCDCRMSHYAGLLRKALDAAGFDRVPVVTTDFNDSKKSQPGVQLLGIRAVLEAVWTFLMLDMLTDIVRKIRPYELHPGETQQVYRQCVVSLADGIRVSMKQAGKNFEAAIDRLSKIPYDRSHLKQQVLVTGELLVTYHPGSNFHIEEYMEKNGMEVIFPRVTDQLRKDFLASLYEIKDYHANIFPYPYAVDKLFDTMQKILEKTAARHPLYEPALRPRDIYQEVAHIIPVTLSCGEGWLMAAEIAHYAKSGIRSFIILQPFGCLPNHVCGRGTIKALKDDFPQIQILPLDLDPDTSYANVENRLQMLIMNN